MLSQVNGSAMSPATAYNQYTASNAQVDNSGAEIVNLAKDITRMNLQGTTPKDFPNVSTEAQASAIGREMTSNMAGQFVYQLEDGTVICSGSPQYPYQQYNNNHLMGSFNPQIHSLGYGTMPQSGHHGPNTPRDQPWMRPQSMPPVPDLINRRGSWSSNEEASPHTPAFGNWQSTLYANKYSPKIWGTPSPMSAGIRPFLHYARYPNGKPYLADFWSWTHLDPAIPEPVPARHSGPDGGRGSLDKILDNPDGTTNVYVRGLQPETTDELLGLYGQRFGEIDSQKAIIDHSTGKCKGSAGMASIRTGLLLTSCRFGFIKYHNFIAAENCIRAFYHLGYEAKFARVRRLAASLSPQLTHKGIAQLALEGIGGRCQYQSVHLKFTKDHQRRCSSSHTLP